MPSNRHRIQRQVIELEFGSALSVPASQEMLARELRERVMPALCAAFDAAAGADELLRLDRLEVDLGTISDADWTSRFRERLVTQITLELARFVPEVRPAPLGSRELEPSAEPTRQFVFFLVHGRLPWWGTRPNDGFAAVFARKPAALDWNIVRRAVLGDAGACERLVDALDDDQLQAGVARWRGLPHAARALAALTPVNVSPDARLAWRRRFWLTLIDWVLHDGMRSGRQIDLVQALRAERRAHFGSGNALPGGIPRPIETQGDAPSDALPGDPLPSPWREWLAVPSDGATNAAAPAGLSDAPTRPPGAQPLIQVPDAVSAQRATPEKDDHAIYLPCAGVVLLHPFLDSLFRDRGLLEGRDFRDAAARGQAVRLVGLLGFGATDVPEYDLVIAKRLCGMPLAQTLAPSAIDAADVAACDELLTAVLGHWKALRSSSAPWLRAQFFLRDGKLESVDAGCRLTVERRAQDVLLARLPWGFGVIGLPWMTEKIFVRWLD